MASLIRIYCAHCEVQIMDVAYELRAVAVDRPWSPALWEGTYLHYNCIVAWCLLGLTTIPLREGEE